MKHILMACGTGSCTYGAVCSRVSQLLDANGYEGHYALTKCRVTDVPSLSKSHDFVVSTCMMPRTLDCPCVNAVPFLTGGDTSSSARELLSLMAI